MNSFCVFSVRQSIMNSGSLFLSTKTYLCVYVLNTLDVVFKWFSNNKSLPRLSKNRLRFIISISQAYVPECMYLLTLWALCLALSRAQVIQVILSQFIIYLIIFINQVIVESKGNTYFSVGRYVPTFFVLFKGNISEAGLHEISSYFGYNYS